MNRIHTALSMMLILGAVLSASAFAGDVDRRDLDFIRSAWSSGPAASGNPDAWSSAGIVSRADYAFVTRDGVKTTASATHDAPHAVGILDGADYRRIAGDGSPGSTCQIALVAAINPGC